MAASVELGGECLTEAGDEDVQVLGLSQTLTPSPNLRSFIPVQHQVQGDPGFHNLNQVEMLRRLLT